MSDRYGTVILLSVPGPASTGMALATGLDGQYGRLVASVTETRQSQHIGDLFRGLAPPRSDEDRAAIGQEYTLGEGTVFYEDAEGSPVIGLRPDEDRAADWLDPTILYLLHEQSVVLTFVPSGG